MVIGLNLINLNAMWLIDNYLFVLFPLESFSRVQTMIMSIDIEANSS
jgi:hypothetical protein